MSIDVEESITIGRPRQEVAGYAMDPARDTEWIAAFNRVEVLTEPPVGVGTRVRRVARFLGRTIDYVLEIAEHEPGRRVVMRSVRSPFPMVITYRFADDPAGTRASIRVQGDAGGFYRLAEPLLAGRVRGDVRADLRRLQSADRPAGG